MRKNISEFDKLSNQSGEEEKNNHETTYKIPMSEMKVWEYYRHTDTNGAIDWMKFSYASKRQNFTIRLNEDCGLQAALQLLRKLDS